MNNIGPEPEQHSSKCVEAALAEVVLEEESARTTRAQKTTSQRLTHEPPESKVVGRNGKRESSSLSAIKIDIAPETSDFRQVQVKRKQTDGIRVQADSPDDSWGPFDDLACVTGVGIATLLVLGIIAAVICVLLGFRNLSEFEQELVMSEPRDVHNGPGTPWISILTPTIRRRSFLLGPLSYAILKNVHDGTVRVQRGPGTFFAGPYEDVPETLHEAIAVKPYEYLKVFDSATANTRIVKGPLLFYPLPSETYEHHQAISVAATQYVEVRGLFGESRVVAGPTLFFPDPSDDTFSELRNATALDDATAAIVMSRPTGSLRLVTKNSQHSGMFIPQPQEAVVELRRIVHVANHEVAVVKDATGDFIFHWGNASANEGGMSFFVPPGSRLVIFNWTMGGNILRQPRVFEISAVDMDPRRMALEFEGIQTKADNMYFEITVNVLWKVHHIPTMIRACVDPPREIWYRLRSRLAEVARRSLWMDFVGNFTDRVKSMFAEETNGATTFYANRGVLLLSIEPVSITVRFDSGWYEF